MIELAHEIRDCVYVSGIILKYWVYFYTTSGLTHCRTLTHSCQDSQIAVGSFAAMALGLLQDSQHSPRPPGTSPSKLILNDSVPVQCQCFPGYRSFPLQYSSLPPVFLVHCAHHQQGSALTPASFWRASWRFSWNTTGVCSGLENGYRIELKRQRAVFSLSLATPNSALPGTTLLKAFHFVQ